MTLDWQRFINVFSSHLFLKVSKTNATQFKIQTLESQTRGIPNRYLASMGMQERKSPSIESILWMAKWQSNELVLVRPSLWNVFVSTVSTIWCPGGWLLIRQQVGGESVYLECVRCPPFGVLVSGSPAVAAPNHQHHLCWPKQALDTPLVSMVCPSNGQTVFSRHTATGHWTLDTGHTMFSGPPSSTLHLSSFKHTALTLNNKLPHTVWVTKHTACYALNEYLNFKPG